jgi:hypothetical protein
LFSPEQGEKRLFYFAFLLLAGVKEKAVSGDGVTIKLSGSGVTVEDYT